MGGTRSRSIASTSESLYQRLLSVAEIAAQQVMAMHRGVLAVYLTGSVARGVATRSSDLDICAIVEEDAVVSRQPPIIIAGIPVFYRLHPLRFYSDVEALLTGSIVLSAQIVDAVPLYDPREAFAKIRRAVLQRYGDPFYLKARVSLCLDEARRHLLLARLSAHKGRAYEAPSHLAELVVYGLAPAVFFLADEPPTERRCLAALKPAFETLRADRIYNELVSFLGLDEASKRWAEQAMAAVRELTKTFGPTLKEHNPRLYGSNADWMSSAMAEYFVEGAGELLVNGEKEASIYCSMVIASRILDIARAAKDSLPSDLVARAERLGSIVFGVKAANPRAIISRLGQAEAVINETRRVAALQLRRAKPVRRNRGA